MKTKPFCAGFASTATLAATALFFVGLTGVNASLILSANDERVLYVDNQMTFVEEPGVGNVTLLDFSTFPPTAGTIHNVPVTVIGPPTCVALVPGRPLAILTSAMVTRKTDGDFRHEYDSRVALLDLRNGGKLIGLFETGLQPSGVAVTPDGAIAWLANRAEGTVSVMLIGEEKLVERAKTKIARETDSLSHVEISPDGRFGIATLTEAGGVLVLRIRGNGVPRVSDRLSSGGKPYAARFLPDGSGFVVADIEKDEVLHYSFANGTARLQARLPVGRIPEGIDVSPDGEWIAVSCFDGGNLTDPEHPKFGEPSRIYFLRRTEEGFSPAGAVEIDGAPQFAVFSADGRHLAVSNTGRQRLSFFELKDGGYVDTGHFLPLDGEPVAAVGSR